MQFSLIVATLGRTFELNRLLESLDNQTHRDFEIIIVDQNPDQRLLPIIENHSNRMTIRHLTGEPGVSRARNLGIRAATGSIVCFPDDDCWYRADLLERVSAQFGQHNDWQCIVGEAVDEAGNPVLPWRDRAGPLTRPMSWRRSVCFAIFIRAECLARIGEFDETLGPGTGQPWGCGEDNDLVLRTLEANLAVQYVETLQVFHPRIFPGYDRARIAKRYRYSLGDGRLLRKHPMPWWWMALCFGVPLARAALASIRLKSNETRFHLETFRGRLGGYLSAELGPVHPPDSLKTIERT